MLISFISECSQLASYKQVTEILCFFYVEIFFERNQSEKHWILSVKLKMSFLRFLSSSSSCSCFCSCFPFWQQQQQQQHEAWWKVLLSKLLNDNSHFSFIFSAWRVGELRRWKKGRKWGEIIKKYSRWGKIFMYNSHLHLPGGNKSEADRKVSKAFRNK